MEDKNDGEERRHCGNFTNFHQSTSFKRLIFHILFTMSKKSTKKYIALYINCKPLNKRYGGLNISLYIFFLMGDIIFYYPKN